MSNKHPLTVRFSEDQFELIENLSKNHGISMAESARRVFEKGACSL